jgi:hypothetical protein
VVLLLVFGVPATVKVAVDLIYAELAPLAALLSTTTWETAALGMAQLRGTAAVILLTAALVMLGGSCRRGLRKNMQRVEVRQRLRAEWVVDGCLTAKCARDVRWLLPAVVCYRPHPLIGR